MKRIWQNLQRLYRVGCTDFLLVFELVWLVAFGLDLLRYHHLGMSMGPACRAAFSWPFWVSSKSGWATLMLLALVLPVVAGVARTKLGRPGPTFGLRRRGRLILGLHLAAALALALCVEISAEMERFSGLSFVDGRWEPSAFRSWLKILLGNTSTNTWILGSTVVTWLIGSFVVEFWFKDSEPPPWFLRLERDLHLADLEGQLLPCSGLNVLNFNSASVAPETRFIRREARAILDAYQALVPGSRASADYLADVYRECSSRIEDFVNGLCPDDNVEVRLLGNTTRALEVCVQTYLRDRMIVVSPFEHPSVAQALMGLPGRRCELLPVSDGLALLEDEWDQGATHRVAEAVVTALGETPGALVISEVHYATGLVLPVSDIIAEVVQRAPGLVAVCDGAHGAGNVVQLPGLEEADVYVASSHKWLMASEPSGILIAKADRLPQDGDAPQAHDMWSRASLPNSTAAVGSLASLSAALKMFSRISIKDVIARSRRLREIFEDSLTDSLEVVGEKAGLMDSCMLALRPADGFVWKHANPTELVAKLADKGALVGTATPPAGQYWVRVSCPFFHEREAAVQLARLLAGQVKRR